MKTISKTLFLVILLTVLCVAAQSQTNLAGVSTGEKWGYIDKTGTLVISSGFEEVLPFK